MWLDREAGLVVSPGERQTISREIILINLINLINQLRTAGLYYVQVKFSDAVTGRKIHPPSTNFNRLKQVNDPM